MNEAQQSKTALDHVLKYTGVFGGVQGLTILISIVRNKLASHFLGPIGFALIAIYQSVADFVSSTTNCGIPFSSVRELSERYGEHADDTLIREFIVVIRTWCLWTAAAGVLLCVTGSPLLGWWFFHEGEAQSWTIALLAPMIAALSITGGEISILKGLHRLRRIALISAIGALSTLCLTIPFFWLMGLKGIILALDLSTMTLTAIHLGFTWPLYPYRVRPFSLSIFQRGWRMVRIGIPYVLAAIAGAGVTMALPALMKSYGSLEDIGYYRVAYGLMVTYAGIVFSSFEADYFPRLSSVNRNRELRNQTINQQIRVCVLLIAPLLIALILAMPIIIRLLYTENFMPAAAMAICASFYMFLRAITTPIGYTALACGDSLLFLAMEIIYNVVSLTIILVCYITWGLAGAGIGLSLSALFDLVMIGLCYGYHYGFLMASSTVWLVLQQALLLGIALGFCLLASPLWRWVVGIVLLLLSIRRSYSILASETTIIHKILKRLTRHK